MRHKFDVKSAMQRYTKMLAQKRPFFLNSNYCLENLMEDLKTNRAYASAFVNETLGTTLPQLLRKLRIEYADNLIQNFPTMKLNEVARCSGFNNLTSFRRAYKAKYGITPSEGFSKISDEQIGEK
ncbi:MAG: helix-turn-helix domain-containing protein [Bacteroidales bacterium]|nr:helix-turn-helix domain-containing protein [Candidatus Physcousia equi]